MIAIMQEQAEYITINVRLPTVLNEKLMKHLEKLRKKEPMTTRSEAVRKILEESLS